MSVVGNVKTLSYASHKQSLSLSVSLSYKYIEYTFLRRLMSRHSMLQDDLKIVKWSKVKKVSPPPNMQDTLRPHSLPQSLNIIIVIK